jgi:hypothetical protein
MLKRLFNWLFRRPYSVSIEVGPSYETRQEQLARLAEKARRERDVVRSGRERLKTF